MNRYLKILIISSAGLLVVSSALATYFCPIFDQLPKPTGQYAVGSTLYHWVDFQADDRYKEFNVDTFYPCCKDRTSNKKFPYQPDKINALKEIMANNSYALKLAWSCLLSNIYTFTEPNVPVLNSESKYPVVIYLPGIGCDNLYNFYLEELASHGYIIFAIEPPYDSLLTVFPGNKVISIDPVFKKASDEQNRTEIYKYRDQAHIRWNKYIEFTLNKIGELNNDKDSIFYQKLDLDKIGLMGYSHGGAVVTDFCQKTKICKAGINMDGWTKTYNSVQSFNTPFLFLVGEHGGVDEMQELFRNNIRPDFKKLIVQGAGHGAFGDHILCKQPVSKWLGIVTRYSSSDVKREIRENIVSFFDKYLKM